MFALATDAAARRGRLDADSDVDEEDASGLGGRAGGGAGRADRPHLKHRTAVPLLSLRRYESLSSPMPVRLGKKKIVRDEKCVNTHLGIKPTLNGVL